jgi:glycosyltransferase involved in cell wall biosynthesis
MELKLKKILIFTDWFLPGFKAGGPVTSLRNLVKLLSNDYEIHLVCRNKDLGETTPYPYPTNTWLNLFDCKVYYKSESLGTKEIWELFDTVKPDFVYLNSLYSVSFTLKPLRVAKKLNIKTILAPRGMLAKTALAQKSTKKEVFITTIKILGLFKNIIWHATSPKEKLDIKSKFKTSKVKLAPNIPLPVVDNFEPRQLGSTLKLIFVGRLATIKNLHLAIESMVLANHKNLELHIYGPEEDLNYTEKCKLLAGNLLDKKIFFKGSAEPKDITKILQEAHFFLLPTQGENFGHAIAEALSTGLPLLIPNTTPWGNASELEIGFTLKQEKDQICNVLNQLSEISNEQYKVLQRKAISYYQKKINFEQLIAHYKNLFN